MIATCHTYARGAVRIDPFTGKFLDYTEGVVVPRAYVPDSFIFITYPDARMCSVYEVRSSDGTLLPWVRFTGHQIRDRFNLQCTWLHLEFDLSVRPKVWPGLVEFPKGVWRATKKSTELISSIANRITCKGPLRDSLWYASRGGLHVMRRIRSIPFGSYSMAVLGWIKQNKQYWETEILRAGLDLHLDMASIQPSRLMFLPRVNKPKQGQLFLPFRYNPQETSLNIPVEFPIQSDHRTHAAKKVRRSLPPGTVNHLRRFAQRWLNAHLRWLANAKPGDGINNRVYALGGDIRQFAEARLINKKEWLFQAEQLLGALTYDDTIPALYNGLERGVGTNTVAIGLAEIEVARRQRKTAAKIAAALESAWS